MSDVLRITGMASGMDTDTTVKKLIELEQVKVDRAEQEKQYLEWQKEDYREIANVLRGFNDEYFDILKPETNMRSANTFNMFEAKAMLDGEETSAISISTSSASLVEDFTINSITKLASNDSYVSSTEVLGNITSTDVINDIDSINTRIINVSEMEFTFDGYTETIELDGGYADYTELTDDLSAKLQEAFKNVDITVEENAGILEFKIYENGTGNIDGDGSNVEELGHRFEISGEDSILLSALKLEEGQTTSLDTSTEIYEITGSNENVEMTINGIDFSFDRDTTVSEVMNEINTSDAGVTMTYDSFSDKFTLSSTKAGTNNAIEFTDTDGLLAKFKIDETAHIGATNAEFVVNGVSTTRASNTFEVNGTTVTLNEITADPIEVSVASDTTDVKDMIVKFVDKYNEVLTKITDLITTRRNYDFDPLTDAEKEAMSEDDIEAWEAEARKGTLHNDAVLERITIDLRNSIYETIEGVGISMYDIGITTSSNYKDQGRLIIDETKLDAALENRPNEVIELFTKQSEIEYSETENRSTRDSENGISYRIFDILQDNIKLTRNDSGNRGYLIEKAGFGTGVDTTSDMAKKILDMETKIDDLLEMLGDKEEKYYQQFAKMESAMAALQAQGDALMSQLGG